jgi:hypothetical protein
MPHAPADDVVAVTGVGSQHSARAVWAWLQARLPLVDEADPGAVRFRMLAVPAWVFQRDNHPAVTATLQLLVSLETALSGDGSPAGGLPEARSEGSSRRLAERLRQQAEHAAAQVGYVADTLTAQGHED